MLFLLLLLLPLCWGIPMHPTENDNAQSMTPAPIDSISQHVFQSFGRILSSPSAPSAHGAFVNTNTERIRTEPATNYMRALRKAQEPTTLLSRYEHELLALGLFLLVPVTIGIVELAESIGRYYADEAYPERGRERHRWEGRERRRHMQMRSEREKMVSEERRWWRCRRDAL